MPITKLHFKNARYELIILSDKAIKLRFFFIEKFLNFTTEISFKILLGAKFFHVQKLYVFPL